MGAISVFGQSIDIVNPNLTAEFAHPPIPGATIGPFSQPRQIAYTQLITVNVLPATGTPVLDLNCSFTPAAGHNNTLFRFNMNATAQSQGTMPYSTSRPYGNAGNNWFMNTLQPVVTQTIPSGTLTFQVHFEINLPGTHSQPQPHPNAAPGALIGTFTVGASVTIGGVTYTDTTTGIVRFAGSGGGGSATTAKPAYVMTLRTKFNKATGKVEVYKHGVFTHRGFLNQRGGRLSRRQLLRGYR